MPRVNCYSCREFGECEETHDKQDLRWAKYLNGWFYWGEGMEKAKGRRVKICRWCIESLDYDDPKELQAAMFAK